MAEPQVGAAQAYVEAEFGGPCTEEETEVAVDTTVTKLIDNNPERVSLSIINVGNDTLYVLFDDGVSSTRGIVLNANGGLLSLNVRDDQMMSTRRWYGIAGSSSTDVLVVETKRYAYSGPTSDVVKLQPGGYRWLFPLPETKPRRLSSVNPT